MEPQEHQGGAAGSETLLSVGGNGGLQRAGSGRRAKCTLSLQASCLQEQLQHVAL